MTSQGKQWETVSTAGSYLSSSDKPLHSGLGSDVVVKSVEILWPNGIHQKVDDVRADKMLTIDERDQPTPAKGLPVQTPVKVPVGK